jgi:predicted esterase
MSTSAKLVASSENGIGAFIFLHGLGDTPAGWKALEQILPKIKSRLSAIQYVFPPAPIIPLSINGGAKKTGWFDIYEWPISIGDPDDKATKMKSVAQVEGIILQLMAEHNIERHQIVVGGFSQGGAIALLSAYHTTTGGEGPSNSNSSGTVEVPLAGCVCLSGWLTLVDEVKNGLESPASIKKKTPCFWGHGQYDGKVLFSQQKFGVDILKGTGISVQDEQYSVGHSSLPKEMSDLAEFLDTIFFGTEDEL